MPDAPNAQSFTLRRATVEDAALIVSHRRRMFEAMGSGDAASLDRMDAAFLPWVSERLANGAYRGFLLVDEAGHVVAGAGLVLLDWAPGPQDSGTRRGYVYNVWTEPAFRGRGLARRLMHAILDHVHAEGVRVLALHASDAGRPIYEALGFQPTNEMRLLLD